jgi:hypothetical protein
MKSNLRTNIIASDLPTDGSHWKPAPCITAPNIPYPHLINLIKLRTSNHKLAIQQLRQVYPIVPRASRTCPLCRSGDVQGERHMMFDCPTLATARLQYHVVFGAHVEMKAACTNPLIAAPLASFVHNHVTTAP